MQPESDQQRDPRTDAVHRRAFVFGVARKAVYVAPAAIALHAARRVEAGGLSCGTAGSPCIVDGDCCAATPNCNLAGMGCMGMMGCMCAA